MIYFKKLTLLVFILSIFQLSAKNRGIINQNGNDCFMNASAQAISHIPELREFYAKIKNLKEFKHSDPLKNFFQYITWLGPLPYEPKKINNIPPLSGSAKFRSYWTNPQNYYAANIITLGQLRRGQCDAAEFLNPILNILDFYFEKLIEESNDIQLKNPINSILFKLKYSTKSLECEHFTAEEDKQFMLSLPISGMTLFDCFNKFSEEENLVNETNPDNINPRTGKPYDKDNRWLCETCSQEKGERVKVKAIKYTKVSTLPKYLIIQLKRFSVNDYGVARKIETPIKFPSLLILDKYSSILDEDITKKLGTEKVTYNLFAFICHGGATGGGHYWAYAKDSSEKWYCYNDSLVTSINQSELTRILNQTSERGTPYILLYELNNDSKKTLEDMDHPKLNAPVNQLQHDLVQIKALLQELKEKLQKLTAKLENLHTKL